MVMGNTNEQQTPQGDPERGAAVFKEHCAFCHSIDKNGPHKKGPNLWQLWGREAASAPGFNYVKSDERKAGLMWNDGSIWNLFDGPHIPGTRMIFTGLKENKQERADLLSFLKKTTSDESSKKG